MIALSIITIYIFSAFFALSAVNTKYMKILLYNCRKYSTNHTFLCKTKPISKSYQSPQALSHKQLTKIFASLSNQKTKPIQSQTNPISKIAKMNATYFIQRNYEQKLALSHQKNKANSKPISKTSKNAHNFFYNKELWKYSPLRGQKNKAKQTQFQSPAYVIRQAIC